MHLSITVEAPQISTLRAGATSRATSRATSSLAQWLTSLLVLMAVATNAGAEDYTFTTFAGSASLDGTDTNARFFNPAAVAVDSVGTVYVADTYNHTIRKITAGGVVTTMAGLAGSFGSVDGTGSAARFSQPSGLAVDVSGNVYVADTGNMTVRKITPTGVVSTIAGSAGVTGSIDGPGTSARFASPTSIAIDTTGVLYVIDNGIRKIDMSRNVSTLSLSGSLPVSIGCITVAPDGTIFVTSKTNSAIIKITSTGVGSILTGSTAVTGISNGIGITSAGLVYFSDTLNNLVKTVDSTSGVTSLVETVTSPQGIAVATDGTVFIANIESGGNGTIKRLTSAPGHVLSTYAGNATYHTKEGTADGVGQTARFNKPRAMARGTDGVLYVADTTNQVIRKIATDGTVSTLAGGVGLSGYADGTGSAARFSNPAGIAVDASGTIYVGDTGNDIIRRVTASGDVTTLAGNPGAPGIVDGSGTTAQFRAPRGIAILSNGNLVVADTGNSVLRVVTPAGAVSTVAEVGGGTLLNPYGVAVDASNLVFLTSTGNHTVRTATLGGVVTTLAGTNNLSGIADGTGSAARFFFPEGIAVDSAGNAFIGDTLNDTIRKISASGQVVTIGGTPGVAGPDDGIGAAARFDSPTGLVIDNTGTIYVLDTDNSTIRRGVPPIAATVGLSGLSQTYDGTAKSALVSTTPGGLSVALTYNGSATPPTDAGSYTIVATVTQPGYVGSTSGTLVVSKATQSISFGAIPTQTLGVAPFTLAATASSGLPIAYVISSGPATVSGTTLTITGVGTVVVEAQQAGDANRSAATPVLQSFIVNPAAPIISSATTASGTVGAVFSYAIVASSAPTSYAATGLPAGLLLNSATGVISGTPTGAAVSTISVSATNAGGTGSATLTLTVNPPAPIISSAITVQGRVGAVFTYAIAASGSPTVFGATGLPAGLAINTATGLISGTPTAAAVSTVTISATNAGGTGTATLTLTVVPAVPVISSATTAAGNVGVPFTYAITASSSPTVFGATGLPTGLAINTATGLISGTPTAAVVSTVTISATNAGGTGSATLTLTVVPAVPVISSAMTAAGNVGVVFTYAITASSSPTLFGATGLPAGLAINTATGLISGTPTAAAVSTVTISATNAGGTGSATLTVTVAATGAAPVITSSATASGTAGTAFTFTVTASGTPTSFGATGLPPGLTIDPSTGVISGTPTAATTSTVTLTATNATGTGTSSLVLTIVTPAAPPSSGTSGSGGGGGGGCGVGGGISVVLVALGMCLRMAFQRRRKTDGSWFHGGSR